MLENSKNMKIAQIAPISESIPPKKYGGTERVVYELTEELVKRGHEVTLFATGDSNTSAELISILPRALRELNLPNPYSLNEWSFTHVGNAYNMQEQFDIIHDHNRIISMPTANLSKTPVIMTMHEMFHESNIPLYELLNNVNIVTISDSQIPKNTNLNIVGTVYHGQTMKYYPFHDSDDGYLLCVGRMSREKGIHHAIEVAQALDMPLVIAARVGDFDVEYYKDYIKPKLSDKRITWVGEVTEKERNQLMSRARCLLHPVTWPEPFGLAMIESMACGAPVVAFNKGSIPEVITEGKTGFIVSSVDEMIQKVKLTASLDRIACRNHALSQFSPQRMTDEYEKIYYNVLSRQKNEQLKNSPPSQQYSLTRKH